MLRSAGAILAGFLTLMVGVMVGTLVATALFVPGGVRASMSGTPGPLPTSYLAANLLVSFLAAGAAGALTARLAPTASWTHAGILAAAVLLMSVPSALKGGAPGQPGWYPWVIALIGLAGVALGATLLSRRAA